MTVADLPQYDQEIIDAARDFILSIERHHASRLPSGWLRDAVHMLRGIPQLEAMAQRVLERV